MSSRSAETQLGHYWQLKRDQQAQLLARVAELRRRNPSLTNRAIWTIAKAELFIDGADQPRGILSVRHADSKS